MYGDEPALLAVARETFGGEPLAGQRPLQVAERDAALPRLPALGEDRARQVRHAGGVGVGFRRDVEPAGARPLDHLQAERGLAQPHAGDVHHVDRSARRGRVGDHLLQRVDHAGFDRPAVAHVNEERDLARGRQAEQAEDFGARFVRQVGDAESDAGGAFVEAAAHAVQDLAEFLRGGGALHRAVARQQRAAIVHHRDARGNIAAGGAEIDQRRAPRAARTMPRRGGRPPPVPAPW